MENFNKIPNLICIGQYNECIHYIKNLNINTLSINNDLDHYILINIISNFINQNVMNQKKNIQIELTNFCTELFANFLDDCISNNSEITYIFLTEHERYIPDSIKNKTIKVYINNKVKTTKTIDNLLLEDNDKNIYQKIYNNN